MLLPTANNKLLLQWKGPYRIMEKKGQCDYVIDMDGQKKIFHANMLKKYYSRPEEDMSVINDLSTAVVEDDEDIGSKEFILPNVSQKETWQDVKVCDQLTAVQQQEVKDALCELKVVLSDVPGRTPLLKHSIKLVEEEVIRSKPYPIPYALRADVNREIEAMRNLNIIEPSDSPYSNPLIVVKKPDNGKRLCLDLRKLNSVTIFDGEPMSDPEEIFATLNGSTYFT